MCFKIRLCGTKKVTIVTSTLHSICESSEFPWILFFAILKKLILPIVINIVPIIINFFVLIIIRVIISSSKSLELLSFSRSYSLKYQRRFQIPLRVFLVIFAFRNQTSYVTGISCRLLLLWGSLEEEEEGGSSS